MQRYVSSLYQYVFTDVLDEILGEHWDKESVIKPEYSTDDEEFTSETEELDAVYDENERQTKEIVVVAQDIISMFPRISENLAGRICYQAVLDTEIKFEGIDYEEVAIYVALNHTATSVPYNLRSLVPVRKFSRDNKAARRFYS